MLLQSWQRDEPETETPQPIAVKLSAIDLNRNQQWGTIRTTEGERATKFNLLPFHRQILRQFKTYMGEESKHVIVILNNKGNAAEPFAAFSDNNIDSAKKAATDEKMGN